MMRRSWLLVPSLLATLIASGVGCGAPPAVEVTLDEESKTDNTKTVSVASGQDVSFSFKSSGGARQVTVDCRPSSKPDTKGMTFQVDAPELGTSDSDPDRAGYWRGSGTVSAGTHTVALHGTSSHASCTISVVKPSGSCTSAQAWRSPVTDHTHIKVGTAAKYAEPFPASGNHWGAWAKWATDYPKAIKRGYLLHNLEHGGLVFSYKCSAVDDSTKCKAAHDALVSVANMLGEKRIIVTPDPTQPTMYGIRAWRWAYTSDCLDEDAALSFASDHFRHGREDEDADPPIPYDPTTLDVPCQDLMAAPDSCG